TKRLRVGLMLTQAVVEPPADSPPEREVLGPLAKLLRLRDQRQRCQVALIEAHVEVAAQDEPRTARIKTRSVVACQPVEELSLADRPARGHIHIVDPYIPDLTQHAAVDMLATLSEAMHGRFDRLFAQDRHPRIRARSARAHLITARLERGTVELARIHA